MALQGYKSRKSIRFDPLRLLLGRDVLKAMRDKIATLSASIDEWASVTKDVNFDA